MTPSAYIENQLYGSQRTLKGPLNYRPNNHRDRHRGEVNMIHHPESSHSLNQKKIPLQQNHLNQA